MKLTNVLIITLIIAALIFFNSKCYKGNDSVNTSDTVMVFTTVYKDTGSTDTIKEPVPYAVKGKDSLIYITNDNPQPRPDSTDTLGMVQEYLKRYKYDSTHDVAYGKLRLFTDVSENRLFDFGFDLKQSIPEVTKTVTITKTKKVSFGVQVGAGIMYNGKVHAGPYVGVGVTIRL